MAKVKEMSFHKTLKLSHSYNSFDIGFGVTIALEGDDYKDTQKIKDMGWNTVDNELDKQLPKVIQVLTELGE
jgi:hypothetical protein